MEEFVLGSSEMRSTTRIPARFLEPRRAARVWARVHCGPVGSKRPIYHINSSEEIGLVVAADTASISLSFNAM